MARLIYIQGGGVLHLGSSDPFVVRTQNSLRSSLLSNLFQGGPGTQTTATPGNQPTGNDIPSNQPVGNAGNPPTSGVPKTPSSILGTGRYNVSSIFPLLGTRAF